MKNKTSKILLLSVITLLWVAGIACMFLDRLHIGLLLWGISFIAAFAVYLVGRHLDTQREVDEAKARSASDPEGKA
ncbi:MAG: hypothetical protein II697_02390 [Clostridia bacterium]|nr:hypothetical protein [Clostridia bacterium]